MIELHAPRLDRLIAALAPAPRLYRQSVDGVDEPAPGHGRRYWVVGRELCRFFSTPLPSDATASRQLEALSLEIARRSPFAETGSHFHIGKDCASVWLWDRQATRGAAEAVGADADRLRVVPEPALLARADEGLRLIETAAGYDAQYWRQGCLLASRWWPSPPDAQEWLLFQRGAAAAPASLRAEPPEPERPAPLRRPWTSSRAPWRLAPSEIDLRAVAAIAAIAVAFAYAYVGAEWVRSVREAGALAGEIAARSQSAMPLLDARARATENLAAVEALLRLTKAPSQLGLMARVAEALPRDGTRLTDWDFEGEQLGLGIAADRPIDIVALVRSLEGIRRFKSVAAERTETDNTLRLRVTLGPL